MKTNESFTTRVNRIYEQLRETGDEARQIIVEFVNFHGGEYAINIEEDDHAWVGEEIYATALKTDGEGNVLVFNSGQYSQYLYDMDDYNVLDLAVYLSNL